MHNELEQRVFESLGYASGCNDANGVIQVSRLIREGDQLIAWIEEHYEPRRDFR